MTTLVKAGLDRPVGSLEDLSDYLARGARSRGEWAIGSEMEKLVIDARTGEAAPYDRIETLLGRMLGNGGWEEVREGGRLVALLGHSSSVTLEPGGQLELSGELCPDLHCSHADFAHHVALLAGEARALGLAFLGLGVQPFTPLAAIDWLPKARYRIMAPYMARTGDMGQRMMKQSAGLQVNCDFSDEHDCIRKLRLALALAPLQYALFANSPVMEGRPTGFLSTRGEIWSRTDPDRTGLLHEVFLEGAGFHTYVDYALDVPMYFITRDGGYRDLTGDRFTFRRYLREGFQGHRATLGDWDVHLSTLFPEARLRPQLETRSADSLPPGLTMGVSALVKGLLYDDQAREEAWRLFAGQSEAEREEVYRRSWRFGLRTPVGSGTLRDVARDVLEIARAGLRRQRERAGTGLDESRFLEGFEEIVESGVTLAERLLARWRGSREDKVRVLEEHCGFWAPAEG